MKYRILLLALACSGFASAATYSYTNSWNVAVSQTIIGTTLNANASQGSLSSTSVPYFDASLLAPGETLASVTITYSAPLSGYSPTITETVGSTTGSNTFTTLNASVNTKIDSPDLSSRLAGITSVFDFEAFSKASSHTFGAITVASGSPVSSNLTRTYSQTQFTSTDGTALAQFVGTGNFGFNVTSNVQANYVRTAAVDDVIFGYSGVDSGLITVTYTTVPETSSALLGGLGMLALLRRRRSR